MAIQQPWCGGKPVEIDPVSAGPGQGLDFCSCADCHDAAIANGDGFCNGVFGVNGQDVAVHQHAIGEGRVRHSL